MKTVILSLKGLGDTLLQLPLLKALHAAWPEEPITVIVPDTASEQVFANCPYVRPVKIAFRRPGFGLVRDTLRLLLFLRSEKFEAALTTFPSNRLWYNLLSFWTGAPRRITHSYTYARLRTLALLQNVRLPADPAVHELDHNMELLSGLGLDPAAPRDLSIWLSEEDRAFAKDFIDRNGLAAGPLIGLHPSMNPGKIYKAWGPGNTAVLARLVDWLAAEYGARTVIFSGPEEAGAARETASLSAARPVIFEAAPITRTAALMEHCRLFINTDSGLGHLAAAAGAPVLTVFGPANPAMTGPCGPGSTVLPCPAPCAPCYEYPYRSTYPRLKCPGLKCMELIDLAALKAAAAKKLEASGVKKC